MSNSRYYTRGAERSYDEYLPVLKNRVERKERSDEDREIREAVRHNSASEYLKTTGDYHAT